MSDDAMCPHETRLTAIEEHAQETRTLADSINTKVDTLIASTQGVIDLHNNVSTLWEFARKHGPKIVTFGAGIMTAAGIGNPEVLKFISNFFG